MSHKNLTYDSDVIVVEYYMYNEKRVEWVFNKTYLMSVIGEGLFKDLIEFQNYFEPNQCLNFCDDSVIKNSHVWKKYEEDMTAKNINKDHIVNCILSYLYYSYETNAFSNDKMEDELLTYIGIMYFGKDFTEKMMEIISHSARIIKENYEMICEDKFPEIDDEKFLEFDDDFFPFDDHLEKNDEMDDSDSIY